MPDLLFFKPSHTASAFTRSGSIYPPLGLCQLAAHFTPGTYAIFDAEAEGLDEEATRVRIHTLAPTIVLMTSSSFTLPLVEYWADWLKKSGIQLVVGGPHPTLMPQDSFAQCPSVDVMVRGEADLVLPGIVKALLTGLPLPENSCCLRTESGKVILGAKHRVDSFADLPFPVFTGLNLEKYRCPDMKSGPMVTMMTSRGCTGRCSFCSTRTLHGNKFRGWGAAQVIHELRRLSSEGVREISFFDDNFVMDRQRLLEICAGIVEHKIDIGWFCNARADMLDDEIVAAMARAGCHQVYLGLESGSEVMLKSIHKDLTLEQSRAGVRCLRKHKIGVSAGFIIGLPGETDDTVAQTIRFAAELRPDRYQFSRFTPLPGSKLATANQFDDRANFHAATDDQVGRWQRFAYAAMQNL